MANWKAKIELDIKDLQKQLIDADEKIDKFANEDRKVKLDIDTKTLESAIQKLDKMLDSLGKGTDDFKQFEHLSKELSSVVSEVQSLSKAFGKVDDSGTKTLLSSIQNIDKSLSELSQNILNVNKNMGNMGVNTNGAVKQVENISNAYQNAAKEAEKLADAQSKIGQKTNISSASDSLSEASRNNNISDSIKKKKEALASYELQLEETRYEVEKLSNAESKLPYGFNRTYNDKKTASMRDRVTDVVLGNDSSSSERSGSKKWYALGNLANIDASALKTYQMWQEELQKVGYTLSEIRDTSVGLTADIIPIDGKAITNAEEFRKTLDSITTLPSKNVQLLNQQITELESKISSLKSEIASLGSHSTDQRKDAFPKTSENLEQVAKSEQKVQQEAVATDKALDNISFTPNTEGFDDIIAKFGILREQAEQITKIVKTTKQTADGMPNISYKATLRNGSSYYLGENSTPQVLNASETVYDAKADNAKKLEREKQIWNELTTSLDRYATLQKRIASNNALSTDNEEATKLLEHIHELQRNDILPAEKLTASNEKLQLINQTVTDLKAKLKESTLDSVQGSIDKYRKIITQAKKYPSDFHPSTEYNTQLAKLESANNALKDYKASLQSVTELTKDQQAEINKLTQNCEKAAKEFKKLSAAEKGTVEVGIEKAIQRINKDLAENTKYSAEAKAGLNTLLIQLTSGDPSINLRKITEEMIRIENAEIAAGRAGKSLWDIFKTKSTYGFIGQMQSFLSMYVGFYGMINAAKKVGSTLVELDAALVDLKKTTTMSSSELENFYYDSNDIAKQMGVTTQAIIDQASAWSRLGYSTKEQSETMAKLSSQFASISPGMSTDEAQEGLVSIMKAFDIDPNDVETEIMDKVNVLGNKFAENNQDVVEGLKRSAAAMSAMGQSFTDTAALFTGGMEILQDSESMGTALRTLSMRIRGYDEETNQLSDDLVNVTGEVADLTKTTKNAQGISLFTDASQEHYKSMVQYLGEIADEWDLISEKNQTELLQKLFGKNRANAGAAIIQNFDQVRAAIKAMDESASSADKEMDTIKSSLEYKLNALQETWTGTIQNIMKRSDLAYVG